VRLRILALTLGLLLATVGAAWAQTTTYPIGVLIPLTGGGAAEGPFLRDAATMAVEEIHALLERVGSPVRFRLIIEDTGTSPEGGLVALESLAAAGVQIVIGPWSSGAASGLRAFANANQILVISPSSTSPALAIPDDFLYRLVTPDTLQGRAVAALLERDGFEQVLIFHRGDSYGAGMAQALKEAFEAAGNRAELLAYDPDQGDYAAEVNELARRLRQLGVEQTAVMLVAFQPDGLNILGHARLNPTLRQARWYGSKDAFSPTFFPPHAPLEIGAFMAQVQMKGFFPTPPANPVRATFEQKYRERYGQEPSPWALYMYDAAWLAALTTLVVGEYDGARARDAFPEVARLFLGASGHKLLDGNGDAAVGVYDAMVAREVDGTYAPVTFGQWESGTGTLQIFNP